MLASAALSANVPLSEGEEEDEEEEEKEEPTPSSSRPGEEGGGDDQRLSSKERVLQQPPLPPRPSILRRAGFTGVALAAALRGALAAYRVAREVAGPRGSRARAAVDVAAAAAVAAAALWLAAI